MAKNLGEKCPGIENLEGMCGFLGLMDETQVKVWALEMAPACREPWVRLEGCCSGVLIMTFPAPVLSADSDRFGPARKSASELWNLRHDTLDTLHSALHGIRETSYSGRSCG
jgi:hypothetical protein